MKSLIHRYYPEFESHDVERTRHGARGEDLVLSESARKRLPVSIEVKCQEKLNVWEAIKQSKKNAGRWHPIVIFRRNKCKTLYAIIEAATLLSLFRSKADSAIGSEVREHDGAEETKDA